MKKSPSLFILLFFVFASNAFSQTPIVGSRMNEVFRKTNLSTTGINTPWEITYGPDDSLWITDAKNYTVYKMSPAGGTKRQIIDLSNTGSFSPSSFRRVFGSGQSPWPQGGLAGMAIHPDFMNTTTPKKYVYISYVRTADSVSVLAGGGYFFTSRVVRFTFNTVSGQLESPISLCDTLPGSNDHNSQRMIIAPVNGVPYLFYAIGDMGAGQLASYNRANHAQDLSYYQGKILRFNLEPDGDAGALDQWVPNDNPYNGDPLTFASQSAIWCLGVRNNQGLAYDSVRNILYGASHGPYSDDEVNIIETSRNYGHPIVIGYKSDENYQGANAGAYPTSSLAVIGSEMTNAASIGASYKDPLFAGYAQPKDTIQKYWINAGGYSNNLWPSEAWSGLGLYNYSTIPGWKNSLLLACLKWGRMIRLKLDNAGTSVVPSGTIGQDTVVYFDGVPRYRDMALGPGGKDIYLIMEGNSGAAPSGANNPLLITCPGCVQKFTFLGYNTVGGTSSISNLVPIAAGKPDICENANTVTIDAANFNNNLWVPITDTNSNIIAEINANGNDLGPVTTSMFVNSGAVREAANTARSLYLDRNITITPQTQPSSAVSIRLYLNNAEFTALKNATNSLGQGSSVATVGDISIFKNTDVCGTALAITPTLIPTTNQAVFGSGGYAVQADINSFSTFYLAGTTSLLPVHLLSFKGSINNRTANLQWITEDEVKTKVFAIERGTNGRDFDSTGRVLAVNNTGKLTYNFADSTIDGLQTSVVYYRLKIIDVDGRYTYSNIIALTTAAVTGAISVRPNPAFDNIVVTINTVNADKANWELTDNTGKIVLKHAVILNKGTNNLTISLGKLPAGTYYLKVAGNSINQGIKIQKL